MTAELHFCAGDGWLVRRPDGLLYTAGEWPDAIDAFVAAGETGPARDAVTAAAVDAGFEVPAFVVVTWNDRVECVVFGPVEVHTDDPTAPMLTAAGAGTWLERRLTVGSAPLGVRAGDPADRRARLDMGVVPAGGFDVRIEATAGSGVAVPYPAGAPDVTASDDHDDTMSVSEFIARRDSEPETGAEPPATGVEALAAVVGDDWMEESLGLRLPSARGAASGDVESVGEQQVPDHPGDEDGDEIDDESTWIPGRPPVEAVTDDIAGHEESPAQPLVSARRCFRGHLNPAQAALCRTCGEPIDPLSEQEVTRQPVLANAVLADGTTIPIDGTIVLGRNPDRETGRTGDRARLVAIEASTAVSRTHVALRADEWSLTATDCGSRGGVVVVTPGREPEMLEPWIAQEISVGDTIYLGGPTSVRIEPVE